MVNYPPCKVRVLAPKCPECGSNKVANIIYGYVELSEDLKKELDAGRTRLGGCCVSEDSHVWRCNSCHHEWGNLGRQRLTYDQLVAQVMIKEDK